MGFLRPPRIKQPVQVVREQVPLQPAPNYDSARVQHDLQAAERNARQREQARRGSDDTAVVAYQRGPGLLGDLLKKRGEQYREAING